MHLKYQKVHNYFRSRNRTNHQLMIIFNLYRPFFYSNFYKYLPPPFKKPDSLSIHAMKGNLNACSINTQK